MLGVGQPWEPDPWEYDEDESSVLVAATQHMDELVTEELQSKEPLLRWSLPSVTRNFNRLGEMVFLSRRKSKPVGQSLFGSSWLLVGEICCRSKMR